MVDKLQVIVPAALISSLCSLAVLHPLDVMKTNLQAGNYPSTLIALRSILRSQGITGFASGLQAAGIAHCVSWVFYRSVFEQIRFGQASLETYGQVPWLTNAFAGVIAGVIVTVFVHPLWFLKTRLELQSSGEAGHQRQYKGYIDCIRSIHRNEGTLAFYKGFVPALFLVSNGVINTVLYEEFRKLDSSIHGLELGQFGFRPFFWGATAKVSTAFLTYPIQLTRTRQQVQGTTFGVWRTIKNIVSKNGILGLYKGIHLNLINGALSAGVLFQVFESLLGLSVR